MRRTLHFPKDYSVGTLRRLVGFQETERAHWSWEHIWEDIAEARGDITVAVSDKLHLTWGASSDLSAVTALRPDDLFSITVYKPIHLDDAALLSLQHLTGLRFLFLAGSKITDVGLATLLSTLVELEGLELDWTRITGAVWTHIELPRLRTLALSKTRLDAKGMETLSRFPMLAALSLEGATREITTGGMEGVSRLPHLEKLFISGNPLSADVLRQLKNLPTLRTLTLRGASDDALLGLCGPTTLEKLDLFMSDINGSGLTCLQYLPRLTKLGLGSTHFNDAGMKQIHHATKLKELDAIKTPLTGGGLQHLREVQELRQLALAGTQVDNAGLANLPALNYLNELSLGGTAVTSTGLVPLAQLPGLEGLDLSYTAVDDTAAAALSQLRTLRRLWLHNTMMTDAGVSRLQDLTELVELRLSSAISQNTVDSIQRVAPYCHIRQLNNRTWGATEVAEARTSWGLWKHIS